ncbi:hypothetical protein ACFJIV_03800 [Mucilaginibacter sp. UC70_90]
MMPVFINFNGEYLPQNTPLLTIGNRGFKYGDGLFESMRLMKGKLKFAELHADRLQRGMKALKIDGYSQMDTWFLNEIVNELPAREIKLNTAGCAWQFTAMPKAFIPLLKIKWVIAWS